MADLVLNVTEREEKGSSDVRRLRKSGYIPGVVYGSGNDELFLKIAELDLLHLLHGHAAESLILELNITKNDNKKAKKNVLIKEVQKDHIKDRFLHIDFLEISMTEKIKVTVAIETIGDPVGTTEQGGVIDHILREIEVEAFPTDLPEMVEVDISHLNLGDTLFVKDIPAQEKFDIVTDPETAIITISVPKIAEEEEEAVLEEEESAEPELIGRENKEGEEAEEEEKK